MMIARWTIEARFGHKQQVIDSLKTWTTDIGGQIGWSADKVQIVTGLVGASESVVEVNLQWRAWPILVPRGTVLPRWKRTSSGAWT